MKVKIANVSDAPLIHDLMIQAFMEYRDENPPSSALEETVQSISNALKNGERALIGFDNTEPVGMVRFQVKDEGLYFYRLSVIPEKQGQGIAKKILKSLEDYATKIGVTTVLCKVRLTVPKNIKLYRSIGYIHYDEEVVHKPNGTSIKVGSMKKLL
ncbi:GNAT family N-acetyltransferase [Bacillus norwichensis]|uniref:GNAT family N-acetyltransferase n=1 Tax=Bacillus norwichensis TaxID=2762217 RepID=A0ABR8VQ54_9BACI|nr:GNAT family N-acetyltransferase [Bacillus norwichensis]MBD8006894.1 GNAT family N-acetyltransferase [Bacillus norwichensis]